MQVLVIGGGIAGPVLGTALRWAGIDATVYEADAAERAGAGAFLQLAPNGRNALAAVGLDDVLLSAGGFTTSGIRFLNARGRVVGELDSSDEQRRYGATNVLVRRGRLQTALQQAAIGLDVPVRYGKRVVDHRGTATGVEAQFADGTRAEGDVLIGCDGIGSRTRRRLLAPGPAPVFTGLLNLGGFARLDLADVGRNHMVFGRRAFFGYTPGPDGQVYWFSNVPRSRDDATGGSRSPQEWLQRLRRLHADDPPPVPDILAATGPPVGAWPVHELPPLPHWHDERVCLVGDAAHAMSPSAGQGAAIAIEDAVVLAKCLRDEPDVQNAFVTYQRLRKDRAEAVVRQARRNSSPKIPGPVAGLLRDLLLPAFLRIGVRQAGEIYGFQVTWDDSAVADAA